MKTVVTILQLLCGLAIILIVLFQSGKSQGLSGAIGGVADSFLAKNKAKTIDAKLARATKWFGAVFLVLTIGIFAAGIVGIATGAIDLAGFAQAVYNGFCGMNEVFFLTLLCGGMSELIAKNGGIEWIIQKLGKVMKGNKSAQVGIAAMVSLSATALPLTTPWLSSWLATWPVRSLTSTRLTPAAPLLCWICSPACSRASSPTARSSW